MVEPLTIPAFCGEVSIEAASVNRPSYSATAVTLDDERTSVTVHFCRHRLHREAVQNHPSKL